MKLESLRIFVAVAEREHVTRAAAALHLTQSAVSHAIAQLEQECGLALFSRVGRRVELSGAGQLLLVEARALLARAQLVRQRLHDYAGLVSGELLLHASQTVAGYWLPERMNAFQQLHPAVRLKLAIHNTREVCRLIRGGEAGLGVVEGAVSPDLSSEPVAEDQMWLVVSPQHPWAGLPAIRPEELVDSAWVLREPGSGTRMECEQALQTLGVDSASLPLSMEVASNEAVVSAVETGTAATIVSARVAASRVADGRLHHVPLSLPRREFKLVRHPEREATPAQAAFAAFLRRPV